MAEKQTKGTSSLFPVKSLIVTVLIAIILSFYPLPYYITSPGDASELAPIIKVQGGDHEKGAFMLTTVRIGQANIPQYLWAKVSGYHEILPVNEIRGTNETDEEYNQRQLQMMEDSQHAATVVAYRKAGKKVDIIFHGVYVTGVIKGMPAAKALKVGDKIIAVDQKPTMETQTLLSYLSTKKMGDTVHVTFLRGSTKMEASLKLTPFPKSLTTQGSSKFGLGITYPVTDVSIKTNPPLSINTSEIGGPSAGLMFTLEIYNQLTKGDLTKGHRIAGTGTMDLNENVGPIGGIEQKIVAADHAGAVIFFAPVAAGNYKDAKKAAADIHTKMKVIPVNKLDDALSYLKNMK